MSEEPKVPGSSLRARLKQYQDLKDKAQSAATPETPGDEENKPPVDAPADAPADAKPPAADDPPADAPTDVSAAETPATASVTADSAPGDEEAPKEEPASETAGGEEVEEEVVDEEIFEDEVVEEEEEYEEVEVGKEEETPGGDLDADVEEEILENSQAVFDETLFPQDDQDESPFEDEAGEEEGESTERPILIPPPGPVDPASPSSPVSLDPESQQVVARTAPSATQSRAAKSDQDSQGSNYRCVIYCLAIVAVLAIVAIILPFVIDTCDCDDKKNVPTASPNSSPTVDPEATLAPTTLRLGHFIRTWVIPLSGGEALADRDSPQYLASEFLADEDAYVPEMTTIAELSDRFGLITFYFATGGDSWDECSRDDNSCDSPWLSGSHCDWSFVTCNEAGRVNSVIFPHANGNGMIGSLPPEINLWHELEEFAFINNEVGGNLPRDFGFNMTSLRTVILQGNELTGTIPNDFLSESPLEVLMLGDNQFFGSVPREVGNAETLTQLILGGNRLDGNIPVELADYVNLGALSLASNELKGSIPSKIFSLTNMERLHLDGNEGITGTIPSSINKMEYLTELRLGGTSMRGTIPEEFFDLTRVAELNLSDANFNGGLSENFSNLSETLRRVLLDNNSFTGSIPEGFAEMTLLNALALHGNALVGSVPDEICERRGQGFSDLRELTVDCKEVTCDCCSGCF